MHSLCMCICVCERAPNTHTWCIWPRFAFINAARRCGSQCDASFSRPIHPPTRTKYVLNALPRMCILHIRVLFLPRHAILCALPCILYLRARWMLMCVCVCGCTFIPTWMHRTKREMRGIYAVVGSGHLPVNALQKSWTASWQLISNPRRPSRICKEKCHKMSRFFQSS